MNKVNKLLAFCMAICFKQLRKVMSRQIFNTFHYDSAAPAASTNIHDEDHSPTDLLLVSNLRMNNHTEGHELVRGAKTKRPLLPVCKVTEACQKVYNQQNFDSLSTKSIVEKMN